MHCSRRAAARVAAPLVAVALLGAWRPAPAAVPPGKVEAWVEAGQRAHAAEHAADRRLYTALAAKHRQNDPDVLFAYGRALAYDADYGRAVRILRRAAALAPEYVDVRLHLLRVLGWAARWDEAERVADALLWDFPGLTDALVLRGDIALWRGEPSAAERWYREALATRPDDFELEWKLLAALMEAGDGDEVRAFLDTLPPSEDDRARARARQRYAAADANLRTDATVGYTFTDPGDWQSWSLGLSGRAASRFWVGARTEWERREFGEGVSLVDTTLALPTSILLAEGLTLSVEGAATPAADFAPRGRMVTELAHDPIPLLGYVMGYRLARYEATTAHTIYPTLSLHFWPITIEPTLVSTFTADGQTSLSGRLKLVWHVSDRGELEGWGFVGTEPIEPNLALTLDPPVQAGFLFGVGQQVAPLSRVRFLYSYSTPIEDGGRTAGVADRHTLVVAWVQKFRVVPRGRRP